MNKHWTEKEKITLFDCIAQQGNLEAAFKEAAQKLGRSVNACRYKYYSNKQKKPAIVPTVVTTTVSTPAKSTRTKWTEDEDKILIEQIEANPNSRKKAFEGTSKLTGRKISACAHRWYSHVSLKKDTMCFATVSKTQQVNNRSRATTKAPAISRTSNWWKKVLKILGF